MIENFESCDEMWDIQKGKSFGITIKNSILAKG